ncbi:MAG: pantothenate kinase [Leptolyngbyaceae cyanobacterium HOT.MB2.61]|jgi:type III pantothenate kinase|nr:pantothenate kinase [Leptolyngbyaceae cyanobacterium HOT.MB2.61]
MDRPELWLALVIGNSRLHWAQFRGDRLQKTWNTSHLSGSPTHLCSQSREEFLDQEKTEWLMESCEIWIASVVPSQNPYWESNPNAHFISLQSVPLKGMYPTFGIDRALVLWGAIQAVGGPALVIDAGTALTFTAADGHHQLVGGAILPGFSLQFRSLGEATAALPIYPSTPPIHPSSPRWALNTEDAIASGIIHTLVAGIQSFVEDWWQQFPGSAVVMTGGDGELLHQWIKQRSPKLASGIHLNPQLIFAGIQAVRNQDRRE